MESLPKNNEPIFNSKGLCVASFAALVETNLSNDIRHKVLCNDGKERWIKRQSVPSQYSEWRVCKAPDMY